MITPIDGPAAASLAAVEAAFRAGDLAGVEESLHRWLAGPDLARRLSTALTALAADPGFYDRSFSDGVWIVERSRDLELRVLRAPPTGAPGPHSLRTEPRTRLFAPLFGEVRVRRHRSNVPLLPDVFDRAARLEPLGEQRLEPGEAMWVGAVEEALELLPVEGAPLAVELCGPRIGSVAFHFAPTGEAREAVSVDAEAMHLGDLLSALRSIGHPDLPSLCERLATGHRSHDLRWQAIQAAAGLSGVHGRSLLRRALSDPHPGVAEAARKVLAGLEET